MSHPLERNPLFIVQTARAVREDENYLADFVNFWDKLARNSTGGFEARDLLSHHRVPIESPASRNSLRGSGAGGIPSGIGVAASDRGAGRVLFHATGEAQRTLSGGSMSGDSELEHVSQQVQRQRLQGR